MTSQPPSAKKKSATKQQNAAQAKLALENAAAAAIGSPAGFRSSALQANRAKNAAKATPASSTSMAPPVPPSKQQQQDIVFRYRKSPPSIILHLYASYFKFAHMDIPFAFDGPMKVFLKAVEDRTIPTDLLDIFEESKTRFYEGCLIVEIHDHRVNARQSRAAPRLGSGRNSLGGSASGTGCRPSLGSMNATGTSSGLASATTSSVLNMNGPFQRVALRPTQQSVWADISMMADSAANNGNSWSTDTVLEIESKILLATEPALCLDPSVAVLRLENAALWKKARESGGHRRRRKLHTAVRKEDRENKTEFKKMLFLMDERIGHNFQPSYEQAGIVENWRKRKSMADAEVQPSATSDPMKLKATAGRKAEIEALTPALDGRRLVKTIRHEMVIPNSDGQKNYSILFIYLLPNGEYEGDLCYCQQIDAKGEGQTLRWKMPNEHVVEAYLAQFKELCAANSTLTYEQPPMHITPAIQQRLQHEQFLIRQMTALAAHLRSSAPNPKELIEAALAGHTTTVPLNMIAGYQTVVAANVSNQQMQLKQQQAQDHAQQLRLAKQQVQQRPQQPNQLQTQPQAPQQQAQIQQPVQNHIPQQVPLQLPNSVQQSPVTQPLLQQHGQALAQLQKQQQLQHQQTQQMALQNKQQYAAVNGHAAGQVGHGPTQVLAPQMLAARQQQLQQALQQATNPQQQQVRVAQQQLLLQQQRILQLKQQQQAQQKAQAQQAQVQALQYAQAQQMLATQQAVHPSQSQQSPQMLNLHLPVASPQQQRRQVPQQQPILVSTPQPKPQQSPVHSGSPMIVVPNTSATGNVPPSAQQQQLHNQIRVQRLADGREILIIGDKHIPVPIGTDGQTYLQQIIGMMSQNRQMQRPMGYPLSPVTVPSPGQQAQTPRPNGAAPGQAALLQAGRGRGG